MAPRIVGVRLVLRSLRRPICPRACPVLLIGAAWVNAGCAENSSEAAATAAFLASPSAPAPQLRDDFEGDAPAAFWLPGDHGSGRYATGAVEMTDEHARRGRRSARITLREGDVRQTGDSGQLNERAELDSGAHALLGQDVWCAFSFRLADDFPIVDTRLVLSQWKQSGLSGSPVVAQRYSGGRHRLTIRDLDSEGNWRDVVDLPEPVRGRWHDMLFRVRFAADASGLVEVWMDGAPVASVAGPTASPRGEARFYHKLGLYRDRMAEPMSVHVDAYALGPSRASVDPAVAAD